MSPDPLGFVDGPNVYTYVMQNPWTKFDPLGLKAEIEKGERKDDETGKTTTHYNISLTAKVEFTGESAKKTHEEQQEALDTIRSGIEERYNRQYDDGNSVNINVDISIAGPDNEIAKDDHVFWVVDPEPSGFGALTTKMGEAEIGGLEIAINSNVAIPPNERFRGENNTGLRETAAHELGHTLGLLHPHPNDPNRVNFKGKGIGVDRRNPLISLSRNNIMRYNVPQNELDQSQVKLMYRAYQRGELNKE